MENSAIWSQIYQFKLGFLHSSAQTQSFLASRVEKSGNLAYLVAVLGLLRPKNGRKWPKYGQFWPKNQVMTHKSHMLAISVTYNSLSGTYQCKGIE